MFVVTRDRDQQADFVQQLIQKKMPQQEIFCLGKGKSLDMTPADVESKKARAYKVVVGTPKESTGASIPYCDAIILAKLSVNSVTLTQLLGRVLRYGQQLKHVPVTTVGIGLELLSDQVNARWEALVKSIEAQGQKLGNWA